MTTMVAGQPVESHLDRIKKLTAEAEVTRAAQRKENAREKVLAARAPIELMRLTRACGFLDSNNGDAEFDILPGSPVLRINASDSLYTRWDIGALCMPMQARTTTSTPCLVPGFGRDEDWAYCCVDIEDTALEPHPGGWEVLPLMWRVKWAYGSGWKGRWYKVYSRKEPFVLGKSCCEHKVEGKVCGAPATRISLMNTCMNVVEHHTCAKHYPGDGQGWYCE